MIDLYKGDCLEVMPKLIERGVKVDAIITDIPYGITDCKWDSVIPFEPMWDMIKKIRKKNVPIILFGSEPFSSSLRLSNINEYKYDWKWIKDRPTNFLLSKQQPLRCVEDICVFYKESILYNPIKTKGNNNHSVGYNCQRKEGQQFGSLKLVENLSDEKYPKNFLFFKRPHPPKHPTQKPVALMEYLILTYTNEGDTVLDFTMGSGTTGVACCNLKRNFIGIELDEKYFKIAKERINETQKQGSLF